MNNFDYKIEYSPNSDEVFLNQKISRTEHKKIYKDLIKINKKGTDVYGNEIFQTMNLLVDDFIVEYNININLDFDVTELR